MPLPTEYSGEVVTGSEANPSYWSPGGQRLGKVGDKYYDFTQAIQYAKDNTGNVESWSQDPWLAVANQGTNPSGDFGFEKFVLPAAMSAIGLGALGVGGAAGAEAGVTMPAAVAAADPTFGGALTQTAPGVFEATAPVGAGALGVMGVPNPVTGVPSPTGAPVSPSGPAPTVPTAPTPGAPVPLQGTPGAAFPQPVSDALDWMKKNASWVAPTAIGAAGLMRKPPEIPNQAQLQALGAEGAGVAKQLIGQYQSGQLQPGQQASLDQLTQQTKNQIRQYFASIHQSDSTAAMQAEAQVDQQATMMKQQMLDQALQQGLQAIGIAQGPLNTIANYTLQQDTALRQASASSQARWALRSDGRLARPQHRHRLARPRSPRHL